jgi:small subunit ribosomal protein S17
MIMIDQKESSRAVTIVGKVVSNKMHKTIVVQVDRKVKHPLIGKYMKRSSKMVAHDGDNTSKIGDLVLIKQSRPLSKTKNWVLVEVLGKSGKEATE